MSIASALARRPLVGTLFPTLVTVFALALTSGCPDRPDPPAEPGVAPEGDGGPAEPDVVPTGCTVEGVTLDPPTSTPRVETGAPDLSCLGAPEVFASSTNVTAQGCVDIFGIGGNARAGLKIAIFDIDQDPSSDTPAYGEGDIAVPSQPGDFQALAAACPKGGYYRLANVPTHTPLIIKVFEAASGPQQIAIPSYSYGVVLYDRDAEDGAVDYEASLIYKSTYDSIPTLGGQLIDGQRVIYDGEGRGVVAGEARDCLGNPLENSVISSSELDNDSRVVYFNGNTDDPSPDPSKSATNADGLYAILNVATADGTNVHTVVAAIVDADCSGDDCQCRTLGSKVVRTYPDSVTLVSFEIPYPIIDPNVGEDAGVEIDAGVEDAGVEIDAGVEDAGVEIDAGVEDAGVVDAGTAVDGGAADAG